MYLWLFLCNSSNFWPFRDAVTGLGSPDYSIISNLVINSDSYFPNNGAYPEGTVATTTEVYENDDDSVSNIATSGLVISVVSFSGVIGLSIICAIYSRSALSNTQERLI